MAEQYHYSQLGLGDGERFEPTDEEIVGHYLYRKVMGGGLLKLSQREASRVPEADLYAQEPWDIWSNFSLPSSSGRESQDLYLYTRLQSRKTGGGHMSRRVGKGDGAWNGEDTGSEIALDMAVTVKRKGGSHSRSTRVTALKKRFSYRNPKNPEENKRWILHEYSCKSIAGHVDGGDGLADRSWVVCRLRKNPVVKRHRHYYSNNNPVPGQEAPSTDLFMFLSPQRKDQQYQQQSSSIMMSNNEVEAIPAPAAADDAGLVGAMGNCWKPQELQLPQGGYMSNYDENNNSNNMFMASSSAILPSSSSNTGLGSAIRGSRLLGIANCSDDQSTEQVAGGGGCEVQDQRTASFPFPTTYGEDYYWSGVSNEGCGSASNSDDDYHQFLMDKLDLSDPPSWV